MSKCATEVMPESDRDCEDCVEINSCTFYPAMCSARAAEICRCYIKRVEPCSGTADDCKYTIDDFPGCEKCSCVIADTTPTAFNKAWREHAHNNLLGLAGLSHEKFKAGWQAVLKAIKPLLVGRFEDGIACWAAEEVIDNIFEDFEIDAE